METSSSAASENLLRALTSRGWSFRDVDQVKALIGVQLALHGESCTVDLIEIELSNMDLRSIGGKSLPDSSLLRKCFHIDGPKVLQISSVRDISRSTIAESSGNSNNHRRLLRLILTDGHSEITAIEYSHIPFVPDDVVPGTKVRLEDKIMLHSGIVCLDPKVITILGGVVEALYEEWQMNQKYSCLSRSTLRLSQGSESGGPPPFEKLQIGAPLQRLAQQGRFSRYSKWSSGSSGSTCMDKGENSESRQMNRDHGTKVNSMDNGVISAICSVEIEEQSTSSKARPKEVVECIPVQNQAAAQKLHQKMSQPNRDDRPSRGRKHRGKAKQEESSFLTLDEWESRKSGMNLSMGDELPSVGQDKDIARQLQEQFDLEDFHVQRGPHVTQADNIRMSMFNFEREDDRAHDQMGFRGRGRGKGRGRRGGKGRGRSG